jgi:hypothetical protein
VAQPPDPGRIEIRPRIVEGNAARALLDVSADADLLVIGSAGVARPVPREEEP